MDLLNLFIAPAYANEAASTSGGLGALPFLLLMFGLMYFLLIRPQQKKAKEHQKLLSELKVGDEVITNGGVVGKIQTVNNHFANVEISKGVVIKVQKQGINQRVPKGSIEL